MAVEDRLRLERDTGKRGAQGRDPDDGSEVEPWPTARRARSPETGTHVGRPRRRRAKVALRDVARAVGERRCVKGGRANGEGQRVVSWFAMGGRKGSKGRDGTEKGRQGAGGRGAADRGAARHGRDEGRAEPGTQEGGRVPKDLALGCVFRHSQATGSWGSSDGRFLNGQSIFRGGRPRTVFHRVTTAPSFTSPPLGGGSWSLVS